MNTIVDAVRGGVHRDASTAVPGVVLFVCGGAEEKEMLLRFVALGVPIVVLEGTGGYADEISGLRASIAHNRSERRTGVGGLRLRNQRGSASAERGSGDDAGAGDSKWSSVRSKMTRRISRLGNLVALIALKDEATKRIVTYPKLHVVPLGEAHRDGLRDVLKRLLRVR